MFRESYDQTGSRIPDERVPLTAFSDETIENLEASHRRRRHWPHTSDVDHLYAVDLPHDDGYHLAAKAERRDETVEISVFQYDPAPEYDGEPDVYDEFEDPDIDPSDEETVEQLLQQTLLEAD